MHACRPSAFESIAGELTDDLPFADPSSGPAGRRAARMPARLGEYHGTVAAVRALSAERQAHRLAAEPLLHAVNRAMTSNQLRTSGDRRSA